MSNALVVVPTYNEVANIERLVRNIFSLQRSFDVLVVDDQSPDGTATVVRELMEEWPKSLFLLERQGKLGLGTSYMAGFKWDLARNYD